MKSMPKLLNTSKNTILPQELFSDLQLDKILSADTIAVLKQPCGQDEIIRRNELFVLLEQSENVRRTEKLLSALSATERALFLLESTKNPLDMYHRFVEALDSYINSCELLAGMSDLGSLFADIADYISSDEKSHILAKMKKSVKKIKKLLDKMHSGLLSFSDKNWLTPDQEAVSESDNIADCAERLGFTVPKKKNLKTKRNHSLSDAICRLYADEVAHIKNEIAKFAEVDLHEPTEYIPGIKFFLEINRLIQRANEIGVKHCISKNADDPRYSATELYDISLLAKSCEKIIPNDADFREDEPFCFLVGANGGGKTTYLRTVGINLILFLSGCPVFAKEAEIYPFDIVLSHFPKDERFDNIGRLDEEQKRCDEMLERAQNSSAFLFFNETFSGTDDKRGFELLTSTAGQIRENKFFGLYVTHYHEVMSLDFPVLCAKVDEADANNRTFRIVRSKGSTSSYADDILRKYRLDKDSLAARRNKFER